MSNIIIRDAVIEDSATILDFITQLAIYEKAQHEVKTNIEQIKKTIFAKDATVKALICEQKGHAIGFAVYFYNYSTWLGTNGIYLEDLYVNKDKRGKGAGKAILKHLVKKAYDEGCGRVEWSCLDWNTPSREFYESIGAKSQDEWIGYRLQGDAIANFANS